MPYIFGLVRTFSLGLILLIYLFGMRWKLPFYPREFYQTLAALGLLLTGGVILRLTGYFDTTGVELVAFTIGGIYTIFWQRATDALFAQPIPADAT